MQNTIITLCGQCGNAFAKVCEKVCSCPQIIEQNTTNQYNEKIVNTICCALTHIAVIVALLIIILHIVRYIANNRKEKKEKIYKQEQRDFELKKEYQNKVLDYLKGEIESYTRIPKLITDLEKTRKLIDELEDDDSKLKEIKKLWEKVCEKTDLDKELWKTIFEKSKKSTITIDKESICDIDSNLYLSKLNEYIGNIDSMSHEKSKQKRKTCEMPK